MAAWRRFLCLLCSVTLAAALMPLPASGATLQAASPDGVLYEAVDTAGDYELSDAVVHPAGGEVALYDGDSLTAVQASVYDALCAGVQSHAASIDVERFNISRDTVKEIAALVFNNPELWWLDSSYGLRYYATGKASSISFTYAYDAGEVQRMAPEVQATVEAALGWIPTGADEFQRAQVLHDYLVRTCHYSTSGSGGSFPMRCHRAISALYGADKDPVCQGYALAYKLLLARAGIDAVYVGSNAMNHGWNLVKLEGVWYHVDVTWDDPSNPDRGFDGAVSHAYFLKSDASFRALDHPSWEIGIDAKRDYSLSSGFTFPVYKGARPPVPDCSTAGHVSSRILSRTLKQVTCTAAGSTQTYTMCLRCRCLLSQQTSAVKAPGHLFGSYVYNYDAKPGFDGTKTARCGRCGTKKTVAAKGTALKGIAKVRLSKASYAYNGKARKPSVAVYDNKGRKLKSGTHYTVTYASGRVNPGTYRVKVRGKGSYAKSKVFTVTFKVKAPALAKPRITKARGSRKAVVLGWKKTGGYTAGYQIQAATDTRFKQGLRKATVKSPKTVRTTLKALKGKTSYQVRIRSYCRIGGKTYTSAWSAVKTAKTR